MDCLDTVSIISAVEQQRPPCLGDPSTFLNVGRNFSASKKPDNPIEYQHVHEYFFRRTQGVFQRIALTDNRALALKIL